MSTEARIWAKTHFLANPTAKAVLLAIADFADEGGAAWPSQRALAELTEFKPRAIRSAISFLEANGLLRCEERRRPDGGRTSDRLLLDLTATPLALNAGGEGAASDAYPPGTKCRGARQQMPGALAADARQEPPLNLQGNQQGNQGRPRATKAAQDSGQAEAQRDEQAEARAERRKLIDGAVRRLCAITGRSDHSARAAVGAWLSRCNDEAFVVVHLIEEADRREVTDPSMWIEAQLRARNEQGREDRSPRTSRKAPTGQVARLLELERMERENGTGTARPELRVLDGDRGISGTDGDFGGDPVVVTRGYDRGMPWQVGGSPRPSDEILRAAGAGAYDSRAHRALRSRRPPGGAA